MDVDTIYIYIYPILLVTMKVRNYYLMQQAGKALPPHMVGSAAVVYNFEQLFCMAGDGFDGQSHTGHYRHSSHSMAHISPQSLQLRAFFL